MFRFQLEINYYRGVYYYYYYYYYTV